jgi:hypothetical protein
MVPRFAAQAAVDRIGAFRRTVDDDNALFVAVRASALLHNDTVNALVNAVHSYFAHRSPNI